MLPSYNEPNLSFPEPPTQSLNDTSGLIKSPVQIVVPNCNNVDCRPYNGSCLPSSGDLRKATRSLSPRQSLDPALAHEAWLCVLAWYSSGPQLLKYSPTVPFMRLVSSFELTSMSYADIRSSFVNDPTTYWFARYHPSEAQLSASPSPPNNPRSQVRLGIVPTWGRGNIPVPGRGNPMGGTIVSGQYTFQVVQLVPPVLLLRFVVDIIPPQADNQRLYAAGGDLARMFLSNGAVSSFSFLQRTIEMTASCSSPIIIPFSFLPLHGCLR